MSLNRQGNVAAWVRLARGDCCCPARPARSDLPSIDPAAAAGSASTRSRRVAGRAGRAAGINPAAVPARQGGARFAPRSRAPRLHRHRRFLASRRATPRFHVVDLPSGQVESYPRRPWPRLRSRSLAASSSASRTISARYATSNGAYTTGDYYHGKYGLSMKVRGLDWTNNNAESRAIVIHNAWYAEPEMIAIHGKLGRSEGCFAFSRQTSGR